MQIKKFNILLLSSLILLSSCVTSNRETGESLISDDYILKVATKSFDIDLVQKNVDSIQAYSTSVMFFGYVADKTFGMTSSSCLSYITPYNNEADLGTDPEFKSVFIKLYFNNSLTYDDHSKGVAQNIYIYELDEAIDSTKMFNTSYDLSTLKKHLISKGSPVYYGEDTLKVYLSDDFGKELLTVTTDEFSDYYAFKKKIHGLYISTDTPETATSGGRMNYIPMTSSKICVSYKLTDVDRDKKDYDTTEFFNFGVSSAINLVKSESTKLIDKPLSNKLYIENSVGIKPYISAISLKRQLNKWINSMGYQDKKILISRATMTLPLEMPADYTDLDKKYPLYLYPAKLEINDSTNVKYFSLLSEIYNSSNVGKINRSHLYYKSDFTDYFQQLVLMDSTAIKDTNDLWIMPVYYTEISSVDYYEIDLINVQRGEINSIRADKKPTIDFVYSIYEESETN
ncbi:MAG: DUF4270 family protein [Bacteroidales bacterium]